MARGWEQSCKNPLSIWMWEKDIEGKHFTLNESTAVQMQNALDEQDVNTFEGQARCIMECINNETEIEHWLFNQDFFIDEEASETGEPLPDEVISQYLKDAGASEKQINKVMKIAHKEDA